VVVEEMAAAARDRLHRRLLVVLEERIKEVQGQGLVQLQALPRRLE
jgi:hypothetical protein